MSTTAIEIGAPPERVFEILLDPWMYPRWVVGARRVRDTDPGWPAPGTRFHHTVGWWPVTTDDTTEMLGCDRSSHLKLRARAWPFGEADVTLTLTTRAGRTLVTLHEEPVEGPARTLWNRVADVVGHVRNSVSLIRLKRLADADDGRTVARRDG